MSNNYFNFDEFKRQFEELTDLENLANKVNELKDAVSDKYNDVMDNTVRKYDLNTREGYENFIHDVADMRKDLEGNNGFFAKYLLKLLDNIVSNVMENYGKKYISNTEKVNEIINNQVEKERVNGQVNVKVQPVPEVEDDIEWPSQQLSEKQKRSIWRIVDEYVDTMILPHLDKETRNNEDLIDNVSSGLFEFACWIMNKD